MLSTTIKYLQVLNLWVQFYKHVIRTKFPWLEKKYFNNGMCAGKVSFAIHFNQYCVYIIPNASMTSCARNLFSNSSLTFVVAFE